MKNMRLLGCLFLCACGDNYELSCKQGLEGSYHITFRTIGGDCGEIDPMVIPFHKTDVSDPSIELVYRKHEGCLYEIGLKQIVEGYSVRSDWAVRQDDNSGDSFHGEITMQVTGECIGTYKMTGVRF